VHHRTWILLTLLAAGLAGCGPRLREQTEFTPEKVRKVLFADTCRLQRLFDRHGGLKPRANVVVDVGDRLKGGRATFELRGGPHLEAFARLVRRLYTRVPKLGGRPLRVVALYRQRVKRRTMPIGAVTEVFRGDQLIELPYHPCVGAFFFGADHYAIRRRLKAR